LLNISARKNTNPTAPVRFGAPSFTRSRDLDKAKFDKSTSSPARSVFGKPEDVTPEEHWKTGI
jgi:hypothetical protein